MAPHIANFLLGSFGIVAAIVLLGGSTFLRGQRARHRYELARRAIEAGLPLPKGSPAWLASRRQAISIATVGVGLVLVGIVAWRIGRATPAPSRSDAGAATPAGIVDVAPSPGGPIAPPRPDPAMEAWHAAQERVVVGQSCVGCGVILAMLGLARVGFSVTERKHAAIDAAVDADAAA